MRRKRWLRVGLRCLVFVGLAFSASVGLATEDPAPAAAATAPTSLRVSTKIFEPFVFKKDDAYAGFSIDLWDDVSKKLGLATELVATDSVAELLDMVRSGQADVAIAGITITSQREESIDFSHSFFESGLQIMVSDRAGGSFWRMIKGLFSKALLITFGFFFAAVLFAAHVLWFFERRKNSENFPRAYVKGLWEAFWWSSVTATTVGYGDRVPRSTPGRLVALIWMFAGIILISFFTASVTTQLTVSRLEGSINGPSDLPGHTVGTVGGSTSEAYLQNNAVNALAYDTVEGAYEALLAGKVEAVVYDSPVLRYHAKRLLKNRVRVVGPIFQKQSYGIALPNGSPYREQINRILLDLRESGRYQEIYVKWFGEDVG